MFSLLLIAFGMEGSTQFKSFLSHTNPQYKQYVHKGRGKNTCSLKTCQLLFACSFFSSTKVTAPSIVHNW